MTTVKQLLQYWPILLFAFNIITAWAAWSLRQLAKNEINAAVAKLQAKDDLICLEVNEHDTRLTKAEGKIDALRQSVLDLPTRFDLEKVAGDVRGVAREVSAANAGIDRIEGYFIQLGVGART